MRLAVMQPYLFPYLGYYQLVNSADKFVFYDDVNFIKRSYINHNDILVGDIRQRFTLPVIKASQNAKINQLSFSLDVRKPLLSIQQAYRKSPFFNQINPIIEEVLLGENRSVTHVCRKSIELVFSYLGIDKTTLLSSELDFNRNQSAADKLISISTMLECKQYINSLGGRELYTKPYFLEKGIELLFIKMNEVEYRQGNRETFVPCLSMIDVLMWNDIESVMELISAYKFT